MNTASFRLPNLQRKAAMSAVVAIPLAALCLFAPLFSCQRLSQTAPSAAESGAEPSGEHELGENELIWAGLSGNPPRFIDSGDEKGLGYLEIQTKLIRKALTEAGFKIRYEYFSSARMAHEFSRKTPICFYPVEWKDPQKTFATLPDRIYSIPVDFKGEEDATLIIRKKDEAKFKKYLDEKGTLQIKALLKDRSLKTLLPKTEGLGREFQDAYRSMPDGSVEITDAYKSHISTRVIRDNHQLIQMLDGSRFDYLLDAFIIQDDYKMIRTGQSAFKAIPYGGAHIRTISDPQIKLISVACGVHPTALRAMPTINATIRAIRGSTWSARALALQEQFEPRSSSPFMNSVTVYSTLAYRFGPDIALGKSDEWYPLQTRHFPQLKQFNVFHSSPEVPPSSSISSPISSPKPKREEQQISAPLKNEITWLLFYLTPDSAWILPKADALSLSVSQKSRASLEAFWQWPWHGAYGYEFPKAWSSEQIETLKRRIEHPDAEGTFETVLGQVLRGSNDLKKDLKSLSLLCRNLTSEELKQVMPLLILKTLKELELISANGKALKDILPALPLTLEHFNLWGSNLREVHFAPFIQKLPHLKTLNLSATTIAPGDLEETLLGLGPEVVHLSAAHQKVAWTEEGATKFGRKVFPKLEVLDLAYNSLDDRHCRLFEAVPSTLRELKINGNLFTSNCLKPFLEKSLPRLQTLELALTRISTRAGHLFQIPPSVKHLDLSFSINPGTLAHLKLPPQLKSLSVANSTFESGSFAQIAKHLGPDLELLDLSNTQGLAAENLNLFKELKESGTSSVKEFRLANLNLPRSEKGHEISIPPLAIEVLDLSNTRLSNRGLQDLAASFGPFLKNVKLSQNVISTPSVVSLLQKSPQLESIDLSDIPDLDVETFASHLPKKLKSLNLNNTGITDHEVETLVPKLSEKLISLQLSGSLFGEKGAAILSEFFSHKAHELINLSLNTPLPEAGWKLVLAQLPPNLMALSFGPATLPPEATALFLTHLPKTLERLHLTSVQLSVRQLSDLTSRLPKGIRNISFFSNSSLLGLGPSSLPGVPRAAIWPDSLRVFFFYSNDSATLEALSHSTFSSPIPIALKSPKLTAPILGALLSQIPDPLLFEISGTALDAEMIRRINQTRPHTLNFMADSFVGTSPRQLDPNALKNLKVLILQSVQASASDLIELLHRLPKNMFLLELSATSLSYSDVPRLIQALPTGLAGLVVKSTAIGPKGVELLKEYSKRVEAKTGIGVKIVY